MTNNSPLIFLDSGIGGLPYLNWLRERRPEEDLIYLADSAGFPYGEKNPDELTALLIDRFDRMNRLFAPKAAVLACNTASVVSLEALRRRFSFPFVGTVPAIKPAAGNGTRHRIGLLATNRTVEEAYTQRLITDFASHCDVVKRGAGELVDFVENRYYESTPAEIDRFLHPLVEDFSSRQIDALVLGCTHFVYLKEALERGLPGVSVVDSVDGVGRQILRVLDDLGRGVTGGRARLYTTGGSQQLFSVFARRNNLEEAGILP
jgi:glutamate racemase